MSDDQNLPQWEGAGVPAEEVQAWQHDGFSAHEASQWREKGVGNPEEARAWMDAGFGLNEAGWLVETGLGDPAEAKAWWDAGFSLKDAARWRDELLDLQDAIAWRAAGFSPKEAGKWDLAVDGVDDANAWRSAGFSVEEAESYVDVGDDIEDALRDRTAKLAGSEERERPTAPAVIRVDEPSQWRPAPHPGRAAMSQQGEEQKAKSTGARNALLVVAAVLLVVAGFLVGHAWTYSDAFGDTGTCGSVLDGSSNDSLYQLDIPGATNDVEAAYCDHQRSTHKAEAGTLGVLALGALGGAWGTHRAGRRDRLGLV